MKTRLLIIIGIIIIVSLVSIITISYVYDNFNDVWPIIQNMCPYIPISDEFSKDCIFYSIGYEDPVRQLNHIWDRTWCLCGAK